MSIEQTAIPADNFFKSSNYKGIRAWIFSTDHKRIGLLYMYSIAIFFGVAVIYRTLPEVGANSTGKNDYGSSYI